MATKKRLSDLVREEVKKQADDETAAAQTTPKKTPRRSSKRSSATDSAQAKSTKKTPAKGSTATTGDNVASLKAQITDLEKRNKTLTTDNAKLQTKVDTLEQKVAAFQDTEKALKTAQSKQKSMLLTLDEAKQDALKLAQENQKLLDKIKAIESAKSTEVQRQSPKAAQAAPVRASQARGIQRSPRSQPVVYKAPAKKPFSRPVVPSRMPPQRVVQNSDEFETWCYD